jgi:hypothetical protein
MTFFQRLIDASGAGFTLPAFKSKMGPIKEKSMTRPTRPPGSSKTQQKTPKKAQVNRRAIRLDGVNPSDFMKYDFMFACEQCSHFDNSSRTCTIGYDAQHTRDRQLRLYNLTGKMAFCRFMEID